MPDITDFQTMNKFYGLNTVDDATRLKPKIVNREYIYPLLSATNLDIDNSYSPASRSGYDDVKSGTDIHSLWSNGALCFYVDGGTLYQLKENYTTATLRTDLTANAHMSYAPVNDRVYCTNGYQIGYIKDLASTSLTDPSKEFKAPLPAGQLIEYYRGCLYVASGSILYISDPLCDYFDIRSGYRQFASRITLLRAIDDGIYVGDSNVYYLKGLAPSEFERSLAYPHQPIPFTDIRIEGQHIGEGIKDSIAMWTSENGVCMGDNSGMVTNITEPTYLLTPTGNGAAFIRNKNNIYHYVNSLY